MAARHYGYAVFATVLALGAGVPAYGQTGAGASDAPRAKPNTMVRQQCTQMRRQVMAALAEKEAGKKASSNTTSAKQEIVAGNRSCTQGNIQTAQAHYQRAIDLLSGGG